MRDSEPDPIAGPGCRVPDWLGLGLTVLGLLAAILLKVAGTERRKQASAEQRGGA